MVSPDGFWMWNGAQWVPNTTAPAAAQAPTTSPDGLWIWNGTQWVPNAYQAIAPYASAGFRALLATLFLALNVFSVLLLMTFDVLDWIHVAQGGGEEGNLFVAAGLVALFGAVAYYGSFIPAVVFFCMWLHRTVRNMPSLGSPNPRFSPGVAVGLCFVPFLNLVQPLLSVLDAWRGSAPDRRWLPRDLRTGVPPVIVGWWAAWLVARVLTWSAYGLGTSSDAATLIASSVVDLIGNSVLIVAGVLAIAIVRQVTARQDRRNELIESGQLV